MNFEIYAALLCGLIYIVNEAFWQQSIHRRILKLEKELKELKRLSE